MKSKKIYLITTIYLSPAKLKSDKMAACDRKRCVGYYFKLKDALYTVKSDWADLEEHGYYNFLVIEGMVKGLYGGMSLNEEFWYIRKNGKWEKTDKPKCFKQVHNFGIG